MCRCKTWPYVPVLDASERMEAAKNSASGIDKRNALLNTPIHAGLLTARIAVPKIGPTEGRNFKFG
jgi:hypothetical protein